MGAIYMRLVGHSLDVYNYLEPLLNDYRKLKVKNKMGGKFCNLYMSKSNAQDISNAEILGILHHHNEIYSLKLQMLLWSREEDIVHSSFCCNW